MKPNNKKKKFVKFSISNHAQERYTDRYYIGKNIKREFKKAILLGNCPQDYCGDFKDFLLSKEKKNKIKIKVYRDFLFIHKNRKLITIYAVPKKYQPARQFLRVEEKKNMLKELVLKEEELKANNIDYNFFIKKPGSNNVLYTIAMTIDQDLVAVCQGKDIDKIKLACIKIYENEK